MTILRTLANDQIEKLEMSTRKVRKHITLFLMIVPLAAIISSFVLCIPLRATDKPHTPLAPSLSQLDVHEDGLDTNFARRPKSGEDINRLPAVDAMRERSTSTKVTTTPSENVQAMSHSTDFEARANDLLNPVKEKLQALISDNTKLEENVAELEAKLRDAREAFTAANERYSAEQQKSDQLIEKLKNLLTAAKTDAESLASRHQKLLAERQENIISKETIAELRAELRDARHALSTVNERHSAEQNKSDQLIEELKNSSNATERDADALAARHQKLAADYQTAISAREQAEAALSETKRKLLDIQKKYQQMSAVLEKMVQPKKARDTALAWQRLRKEAHDVAGQTDKAIQLAAEKLTTFDRRVETVNSTPANTSSEGARTARELKKMDQDLDAIRRSASKILEHFQKTDTEIQKNSEALTRNSNSLDQSSNVIQQSHARLDHILKDALGLQKKKSSIQTRVNDLVGASQLVSRLSTTVDAASTAIAEKIASLDLMLRQDREVGLPKAEPDKQSHSRIETNLQETMSRVEAAEKLLAQLATAKAALKDQIPPLSKDASELSLQLTTSQHDLRSSGSDLKNLTEGIQSQLVAAAEQIERNSTTLHAYGQDVGKQKRLLSALSLGLGEINKRLDEAGGSVRVSRNVLKVARAELSDQAVSMKRSQATTETVKAKIEGFARKVGDGAKLAKLDQVDTETPSPGQVGRKNGSQQSQAMRKIDSLLARIAGMSQELNARVEQISKLEAELQASGRQLDKMKNSLAKQMAAADDLDPRYAQLEPYYKTLLVQNKALDRAQRAHQERASELLTRVASLQDRLPALHSQLQASSIGEEIQSKIASVLPILAMENIDQRRNQLAKIREKLGALSLSLQSRRTMPPPEFKSDTETSSVRTEPSKKPATGISKAAPKKSKKTAGKLSVECDLARPSCRKWLFLRKKRLQFKSDTTNVSNELTGAGPH